MSCGKTAEPIDLSFGLWTQMGWRKHKFNRIRHVVLMLMCPRGRAHWRQLSHMIEPSVWTDRFTIWVVNLGGPKEAEVQCPHVMRPYVKLVRPLVIINIPLCHLLRADTSGHSFLCFWGPFVVFYSAPQCSHCKHCTSYGNSVRPSVSPYCLSHASIMSRRLHVEWCSLDCGINKCV